MQHISGGEAYYFEVNCFVGLQPNDQLISEGVQALIQLGGRRSELDTNLHLALIQGFAGLQDEGHSIPSAATSEGPDVENLAGFVKKPLLGTKAS